MTSTPAPSDILSEMSACAHRLGVAFAAEAEATEDVGRKLELVQLFDRCFFSVRVAIGLQLRLRREGGARASLDAERAEVLEIERPEAPEVCNTRGDTGGDRTYEERDRDRETERASLPLLLSTLNGVAKAAAALPGPTPAALPTLTALLARAAPDRAPAIRPAASGLRTRLAGAAAVAIATGPPQAGLATLARRPRPATGPPRR